METKGRSFYHYAFVVVGVYAIALPAVFMFSNTFSLYLVPITEDLGISRGDYALVRSLNEITSALLYWAYARLEKRMSLRLIITSGALMGALTAFMYAISGSLPMLAVAALCSGAIWPLFSQVSVGNIVNNWFARNGATVITAMFTFSNLCGFFTSKIVAHWITEYGWRQSLYITMFLILGATVIVFLFVRDKPSQRGLEPWGIKEAEAEKEKKKTADAKELPGVMFRDALRDYRLYAAFLWTLIVGTLVYPVVHTVAAHLRTVGFDTNYSGNVVGLFSIGSVLFLIPLGRIMDRWGCRIGILVCVGGFLAAMASLLSIKPELAFLGPIIGISMGVSIILFTVQPIFIREVFGFKDFSRIMSYTVLMRTFGGMIGGPLLNYTYDFTGSYNKVFVAYSGMAIVLLVLTLVATSKKNPLWKETRPGFYGYQEPAEQTEESALA